jgi:hypothetical protein
MHISAQFIVGADDTILAATSDWDGKPVIRFGAVSMMLTWDQLRKVHAECIKLEVTHAKDAPEITSVGRAA